MGLSHGLAQLCSHQLVDHFVHHTRRAGNWRLGNGGLFPRRSGGDAGGSNSWIRRCRDRGFVAARCDIFAKSTFMRRDFLPATFIFQGG